MFKGEDKLGAWAKAQGNLCAIAFIHRGGFWVGGEPRDGGERGTMAAAAVAPAASEEETAARAMRTQRESYKNTKKKTSQESGLLARTIRRARAAEDSNTEVGAIDTSANVVRG